MEESKEIKWRKIGGGSLRYIRGKIVKPNEIFTARPEEVPLAFRKYVVALEDIPETSFSVVQPFTTRRRGSKDGEAITGKELPSYSLEKRSTGGWWDVINSVSGKAINEKGLREEAARQLVEELNA